MWRKLLLVLLLVSACQARPLPPMRGMPLVHRSATINRGLVGYWAFNEAGGTSVRDLSGNGMHLSFVASPAWVVGPMGPGVLCSDTSNSYLRTPDHSLLDFAGDFSLIIWFETTDDTWGGLVNKFSTTGYQLSKLASGRLRAAVNGTNINGSITVNDGLLHMGAFVRRGAVGEVYVDGKLDVSGATNTDSTASDGNFYVGRGSSTGYVLDGTIYHTAVYNRALSAGELAQLYRDVSSGWRREPVEYYVNVAGGAPPAGTPTSQVVIIAGIPAFVIFGMAGACCASRRQVA